MGKTMRVERDATPRFGRRCTSNAVDNANRAPAKRQDDTLPDRVSWASLPQSLLHQFKQE